MDEGMYLEESEWVGIDEWVVKGWMDKVKVAWMLDY